ncbi:Torsin protein [Trichostrongylus colubriformis]|uniref:Torsin protein n=1 Tax=Trichostrongylus colubriformis TaxID=6319 RepID=A0AAN8FX81_TRICO
MSAVENFSQQISPSIDLTFITSQVSSELLNAFSFCVVIVPMGRDRKSGNDRDGVGTVDPVPNGDLEKADDSDESLHLPVSIFGSEENGISKRSRKEKKEKRLSEAPYINEGASSSNVSVVQEDFSEPPIKKAKTTIDSRFAVYLVRKPIEFYTFPFNPDMASPVCTISKGAGGATTNKCIHSVPCKLHYDGPAPISRYFVPEDGVDAKKKAAFRGRGLEGVTLDVPCGYELCVLNKRSAAVTFATGALWTFQQKIKCKLYECCDHPYLNPRFDKLHRDLQELVYGQHLVIDTVENAIRAHWTNDRPKKPLAMSFHGFTGSGKNYIAEIIANNTYKKGMRSNFVHQIVASSDFYDKEKIAEYKVQLRARILEAVKKCNRAMIIFDEADKLPEQLLEVVKPFLDYYDTVGGVDFRKSTFLFLRQVLILFDAFDDQCVNRGGQLIANLALNHHQAGNPREDLTLENFERMLMQAAYNEPGGLKLCELISSHLIDHFVPFLPMERRHVILCTISYLKSHGREDLVKDDELIQQIVDSLQYFPQEQKVFSSSGCKRIPAKADLEIAKRTRPSLAVRHLRIDDNDEL